ncbi:putative bifunctional diguanylate cyclase/phosphodiesterase [Streptomyces sp. NPDC058171]
MSARAAQPCPLPAGERAVSARGAALSVRPRTGGGTGLVTQILLAFVCGGYATGAALDWGSPEVALVMGDFGLSAAAATAAVSCLLYARTRHSRSRVAWYLFALSSAMAALGNGVWGWYEVVLREPVPSPSFADLFFLCFAPPAIVGLLLLAKRPVTRAGWICLALDTWLIGGSLLTLSWSLALAHTARFDGQSVAHAALSLAYPLLDIALVSIVLALHYRRTAVNRSAVNTAIGALAVTVMCDALFSSPILHASYRSGQLLDAGWFAGSLLLAYAPWASLPDATGRPPDQEPVSDERPLVLPSFPVSVLPVSGPPSRGDTVLRSFPALRLPHQRAATDSGGDDSPAPRPPSGVPFGVPFGGGPSGTKRPHEGAPYRGRPHGAHGHEGHTHQRRHEDHGHQGHGHAPTSRSARWGQPLRSVPAPDRGWPEAGTDPGAYGPVGHPAQPSQSPCPHEGARTAPRPLAGSLAALAPYLAATVCTLGILYNVLNDRSIDRVVLVTACTVVLALVVRQGIVLMDNTTLTQELAQKENHFRSLVQGSSDVIMIAAPSGVLRYVSPAAAGVYGRDAEDLMGSELAALIHPDDLGAVVHEVRRFLAASADDEPTTRIECRFRSGSGQWLHVESTVNRHHGGLLFNSRDVTERVRLQAQLQHSAEHDPLTGLPNRALFTRRVARGLGGRRSADRDPGTAVLFIDLDGFKAVNDTIGHQAGDELLVQAARRLQEAVRQSDTAARLGGDEFAALVLGDGTTDRAARERHILDLADRLRARLSEPYPIDGNDVRVAASIGVAFAEPGVGESELLRNADLAMYRAKAAGKGRVELYAPQMQADVVRRAELAGRLRAALDDGEFALLHQPVVHLTTGVIGAVGAQARWRSAEDGLFTPAEFPWAPDDTDRAAELGRWTLEEALARAADRAGAGHPTTVVVRVAARHLVERSRPLSTVEALLARHGLAAGSLVIELADSDPTVPFDELERRLTALRRLGVRIGLDGFGNGHGAFTALRRLPLDILRLDRSLVEGVVESGRLHKITSGLLRIATDLGLESVADGVDLPEQVTALRAMGCTYGQGAAFSAALDEYRLRRALSTSRYPVPQEAPAGAPHEDARDTGGEGWDGRGAVTASVLAGGGAPARPAREPSGTGPAAARETRPSAGGYGQLSPGAYPALPPPAHRRGLSTRSHNETHVPPT